MQASRLFKIVSFRGATVAGWFVLLAIRIAFAQKDGQECPPEEQCKDRNANCYNCTFPKDCKYGEMVSVQCVANSIQCQEAKAFTQLARCVYCYQTDPQFHICKPVFNCNVIAAPPDNLVATKCTVNGTTICIGKREFSKRVPCRWTTGRYKWSTALILSITLGGFGVDRFYLGLWRSGLGKLFSFGGLGVWTIIDVILIATGYVGPADNTLYMY